MSASELAMAVVATFSEGNSKVAATSHAMPIELNPNRTNAKPQQKISGWRNTRHTIS